MSPKVKKALCSIVLNTAIFAVGIAIATLQDWNETYAILAVAVLKGIQQVLARMTGKGGEQ